MILKPFFGFSCSDQHFSCICISLFTEHMGQGLFTCYFVYILVDNFGNLLGPLFTFRVLTYTEGDNKNAYTFSERQKTVLKL